MTRITHLRPIRYEESTDLREYWGEPIGQEDMDSVNRMLQRNEAVALPGLRGWWPYTHTIRTIDGCYYHALLEETL